MIIGQFVDTYPPCVDGVGRVALSYCETLTALGHETYYIAPDAPHWSEEYSFPLLLQRSLPIPGEPFRLGMPVTDVRYRRQVDSIPFDIVHAHSPFSAGEEALRIARKRGIPVVTTFHSKYYQDFYDKTKSRLAASGVVKYIIHFYNRCDGVWTVNNATAEVLRSYGYNGRILVMENGTNLEALQPESTEKVHALLGDDPAPILLFVGQHNYKKNIRGILEACAILKNQGQPFRLVTAGDGPDFADIKATAESLGISDRCKFLGFISDRSLLMALYAQATLLVFPSIYDNAPMVLREAAAMGTPALVVKGSCSAEGITHQENGFVSPDETAASIADTILASLPLCAAAGGKARETIPVAWESIMRQVLAEYQRLIDGKKEGLFV